MRVRISHLIVSAVLLGTSAYLFKLFVIDTDPLESMSRQSLGPYGILPVLPFAILGILVGWRAFTKPTRPTYGVGEPGLWHLRHIHRVRRRPTLAYVLWAAGAGMIQLHGNRLIEPPSPTHITRYRIRVKHSTSHNIETWDVSEQAYFMLADFWPDTYKMAVNSSIKKD